MFSLRSQLKLIRKDGILMMQVLSKTGCTRRFYSLYNFNVLLILCNSGTKVLVMGRNEVPEIMLNGIDLRGLLGE